MNYKIHPEKEYLKLLDFYRSGTELSDMPEDYKRQEVIYKFCSPHVERGYIEARALGRMIYAEYGEKFEITQKTCYNHALNAFAYYREAQLMDSGLMRVRLTKILLKLLDFHREFTLPDNPVQGQKAIDMVIHRILQLNPKMENDTGADSTPAQTFFIVSDNAKEFPELHQIPETKIIELLDTWEKTHALTPEERAQIVKKDINGELL